MKKMMFLFVALLFTMTLSAQDDTEVDFALTFVPNIQFSPVYVAIEKGYFTDEGIEIALDYIDENVIVDLIAAEELTFGVVSGEQVVMARSGRRPVVYVYEWFQQFPIAMVIPDTTDAATIPELEGLAVGVPGRFGATYSGLTALLNANNLTEMDIQLEEIGFTAPDIICAGRVDAAAVYINNEPLQIQQRADAGECGDISSVTVIPVAEQADIVSNGIITSETAIAEQPELIASIVRAFHRGLQDAINNPAEAYLISEAYVEALPMDDDLRTALEAGADAQEAFLTGEPTREEIAESRTALSDILAERFSADLLIQMQVLLATIDLWDADQLGFTDPASWETTRDILTEMGTLVNEVTLEDAYTNQFVPEAD